MPLGSPHARRRHVRRHLALAGASPRGAAARLRPVRLRGAQRDADDLRRLARDSAARGDRRPRGLPVRGSRGRRDDRRRARAPRARSRVRAARLPQAGRHEGDGAVGLPALHRRPPARERRRARDRRRALRPPPPGQERVRAGRDQARDRRDGARLREGEGAARRGPADLRGPQVRHQPRLRRAGDGRARSADRLARPADHRRPRAGPRPDRARRARRARPLPAGSRVGLLLGHDADVLRRRGARGARRLPRRLQASRSRSCSPPSARA